MIRKLLVGTIGRRIAAAIGGVMLTALIAVSLWGWRVDTLRGRYKALLDEVVLVIEPTMGKVSYPDVPGAVGRVVKRGHVLQRERDNARGVVKIQSDSINAYHAETERLAKRSDENRRLAEATIRERDTWIKRAQAAETRTERLSAQAEMEECDAVLDALYAAGF